jgi:hypothetical protein
MSGEINVLSRTQIIVVEPTSGSVSIINAGPSGPSIGGWTGPYLWTPSLGVWDFVGPPSEMHEVGDWFASIRKGRYWTHGRSGYPGMVMFDLTMILDSIEAADYSATNGIDGSHVSIKLPLPSAQTSIIGIDEVGGDSTSRFSWSNSYWNPTILPGCQAFSYKERFGYNSSEDDVQNCAQLVSFPVSEDDSEWQEWMRSWVMASTHEGFNTLNMFWSWPYNGNGNRNTSFESSDNINGQVSVSGTYWALELP